MHGDAAQPDKAVVTKDDYESYDSTHQLFSTALQGDLVSKTFLFVGFSFNDPNLNYILSRIRILLGANRRDHYCLLRRVLRTDFNRVADFHYARTKQELQVKDLKRYGIIGLLVDDYAHYAEVLRRILFKYKLARVFISGSAANYAPWSDNRAQQLIQQIASGLIRKGFGIVSGFGAGVGPFVLNGILDELQEQGTRVLDDRIILRPFPIAISDPAARRERWTAYREDILSHAGVALFLFGNKPGPDNDVMPAEGVEEEFRLAVERRLFVVPVGCTGSAAKILHQRVLDHFDDYYPLPGYRRLFEALGRPGTPHQVAERILKLVTKLWKERGLSQN
jgi:hypothetical protein